MNELSLGLIEVSGLGHAIIMLDDMLKAGDVEFVATERKLGGRLVTIVVRGELTAVKAAVDAGVRRAKDCGDGIYKASQVIARPHTEIYPFLHLDEEETVSVNTESAGTHVGAVGRTPAAGRTSTAGRTKKPAAKRTAAKKSASKRTASKKTTANE